MFEDLITEKKEPKKVVSTTSLYCMRCGYNIDTLCGMITCPVCGACLISINK